MKGVNMKVLWSEFGSHMKAVIHASKSKLAWAQSTVHDVRPTVQRGGKGNWRWAKWLDTLWFPATRSVQMWAILWLQPALCCSKPVNLIPISGNLIMCRQVLAFVRKLNKAMKQRQKKRSKKVGLKKTTPENGVRNMGLWNCLENCSDSERLK